MVSETELFIVNSANIVGGYDLSQNRKSRYCQSVCLSVGRSVGRN
jgi:hypothetical protein